MDDSDPELDFFKSVTTNNTWKPKEWGLTVDMFTNTRVFTYVNDVYESSGTTPQWDDLAAKYPTLTNEPSFNLPVALALSNLVDSIRLEQATKAMLEYADKLDAGDLAGAYHLARKDHENWLAWQEKLDATTPVGDVSCVDDIMFEVENSRPLWRPECPALSEALDGGFRPGTMNLVAADAGVGKSMWLISRAMEAAEQGLKVLFVSLEMPSRECAERLQSMVCGGNIRSMDPAVVHERMKAWDDSHDGGLWFRDDTRYDPSPTAIKRALMKYDVVAVDYGGLMVNNEGVAHADSHNMAEEIVLGLLRAVRRYDGSNGHKAVLLVAAQLSKMAKPIRKAADVGYNVPYAAGTYAWGRSVHCFITLHSQGLPSDLRINAVEKHRSFRRSKPWYTRMDPTHGDFSHVPNEQARQEIDDMEANDFDY